MYFIQKWNKFIGKSTLARIVADINADGHLQIQDWRYLVSFYSKHKNEILQYKKRMERLFGVRGRIYIDRRKHLRYKLFFISKELALFLITIGVVEGRKTDTIFFVPEWIKNGIKKIQSAYLRGLYDYEGCIETTKQANGRPCWRISISQNKNENINENGRYYMEEIRKMINKFGIKTSPVRFNHKRLRKDGSVSIENRFDIEHSSFNKFYKHIGFDNKNKRERLLQSLQSVRVAKRLRHEAAKYY